MALAAYQSLLERCPILTKAATSAVLFFGGDVGAQCIEHGRIPDSFDTRRTVRMTLWGGLFFAPLAHGWFNLLEKLVKASGTSGVVQRVAWDQLTWTPVINVAFFTYTGLSEGRDLRGTALSVKEKMWPTLRVNWVVWPVVQAVNFSLVPLQFRVLFVNIVGLFWSGFLSLQANKKVAGKEAAE